MNKKNILFVADVIERHLIPELGFNMGSWYGHTDKDMSGHQCHTVACIGGTTEVLFPESDAAEILGLNHYEAQALFYANGVYQIALIDITPPQAVKVLRHLAETGLVDWTIITD